MRICLELSATPDVSGPILKKALNGCFHDRIIAAHLKGERKCSSAAVQLVSEIKQLEHIC